MKRISALGIKMSQPLDFGMCGGGKNVYQLLTWCEGEEAKVLLPLLPEVEQYAFGLKAGEVLRKIHTIETYPPSSEWSRLYSEKIKNYIKNYRKCGMTFDGDELLIYFIEDNYHLLNNRPMCLTHGDFQADNLIISPEKELYVIDFQRYRIIDPYCALMSIMVSADVSSSFAAGQIRGYFGGEPSVDFWKLSAFYMIAMSINGLPLTIPLGQAEVDFAYRMIRNVMEWFDSMNSFIPTWYMSNTRFFK